MTRKCSSWWTLRTRFESDSATAAEMCQPPSIGKNEASNTPWPAVKATSTAPASSMTAARTRFGGPCAAAVADLAFQQQAATGTRRDRV